MIELNNLSRELPYKVFKDTYKKSLKAKQKDIEAICIASYSSEQKEVSARFVNLKFIQGNEFIFFSNYSSPKSKDFNSHDQITGLIYWNSINTQIRMKAKIKKTAKELNNSYFLKRDKKKNALAISSKQSKNILSHENIQKNYKEVLENADLTICPDYWGGYSFVPYYFEFWEGHESRLNKREVYEKYNGRWIHKYLQP
jgi:pyridoxamine 5'-phosphate oxidase